MKFLKLTKQQISTLKDIDLIELSKSLCIQNNEVIKEIEPGKYIITSRKQLVELINSTRLDLITMRADRRAKYALIISICAVLATLVNASSNWFKIIFP
ncbi:MAG: hypothetical protein AB1728_12475 [Bacteroidota bacterium]